MLGAPPKLSLLRRQSRTSTCPEWSNYDNFPGRKSLEASRMDDIFKHLRQFQTGGTDEHMELTIPRPRTESGLLECFCPSESCSPRVFQIGQSGDTVAVESDAVARRRYAPRGTATVCPYCATRQPDNEFISPRDREAALAQVHWAAQRGVEDALGKAMSDMARGFNTRSSGGMFSMSMSVKRAPPTPAPRAYREDLLRVLSCDACARTYGVYAVGLFCPDCGATNVLVPEPVNDFETLSGQRLESNSLD